MIASIAAEWTEVEKAMIGIAANAFGRGKTGKEMDLADSNFILHISMSTAETIRGRLAILDNTLGRLVAGSPLNDDWTKLRSSIQARSKERNRIVHASWHLSDQYPDHLIEQATKGKYYLMKWSLIDFKEVNERISNTVLECFKFRSRLVDAMNGGDKFIRITHSNMLGYPYEKD